MRWDFLVINTVALIKDGLANVASRIRYIFRWLMGLEKCVILFYKIEEFCLDRKMPGIGIESRMLTTSMLTAINNLQRKKRSIVFMATNRLHAFDSAITSTGWSDMQLFVGTPNLDARCIQFCDKLASSPITNEQSSAAEAVYRTFLTKVWSEDAMFMNYLEGMQFASSCADVIMREGDLSEEAMASILNTQAAVMTVRGTVRDEYIASMDMSRL
uniref:ATPase AAA-type core domain-containing protein n=1 Tax=Corethron hystrix TaxID=216773 RepID=A0A7S1FWK7_9STRA|mmetsp:Transcript_35037/g.81027  ORF Transcript_35037/g.81027 Transcript_35037/m.81027 type:complete len:215 (+) Transcript_35037:220-864(+)